MLYFGEGRIRPWNNCWCDKSLESNTFFERGYYHRDEVERVYQPLREKDEVSGTSEQKYGFCLGPLFAVQPIPGKGLGTVALRDIPKGKRIFTEPPLFECDDTDQIDEKLDSVITQAVEILNEKGKRAYFKLHNARSMSQSRILGIYATNSIRMGGDRSGIFLQTAQVNHAYRPNVCWDWNGNIEQLAVHAVRDIAIGEELTATYVASEAVHIGSAHRQAEKAEGGLRHPLQL